ncbi:c-type cytochrome biogenesis protein CcmI [Rhodobacteraceae bacterium D3-12]|nr:c-type cytochrome biogenesis protein CcmI [Rhodobacteraceae bacterium D3-12]
MIFWITAVAIALVVTAVFVLTLLRAKPAAEHPAEYDLRVYRDQLREVERDLARGIINEADAERIRTEVGRRVLTADAKLRDSANGAAQPKGPTRALAALVALAVLVGTAALYPVLGTPGKRDQPQQARIAASDQLRATRMSQSDYEAKVREEQGDRKQPPPDPQFAELMTKLRKAVADNPNDLQGQQLLARNEASLGNYTASYTAQQDVIRLKGDTASAADFSSQAEMMIRATGGYVSPQAEEALKQALTRDPRNQPARYFTALMYAQNDRPDMAFRLMDRLLQESRPEAPWVPAIRGQIEELAWRAGVRYQLPEAKPATRGPSSADIANAANLSAAQRMEMVRGMVQGLSERLASQGGSAEDWGKLIAALSVIGEQKRAADIWGEAQKVFAEKADQLAIVQQGAIRAGLVPDPNKPNAGKPSIAVPAPAVPGLPGPSAEDVKNAAELSAAERKEMIKGMVANLSDRLQSDGGTANEWARLITSHATLGDMPAAKEALTLAKAALADDPAALETIRAAAKSAGLAE